MQILTHFKTNLQSIFFGCKPKIEADEDGNIQHAIVFVNAPISAGETIQLCELAEDNNLTYTIKSRGAVNGLTVEFNK